MLIEMLFCFSIFPKLKKANFTCFKLDRLANSLSAFPISNEFLITELKFLNKHHLNYPLLPF